MDEDSRFRRALKNPLVMIGLCLIAGITLYSNVIEPAMHSSITPSVAFTPSLPETNLVADILEAAEYVNGYGNRIAWTQIDFAIFLVGAEQEGPLT